MHRFYSPPEQAQGDSVWLTDREAHHALHVLRIRPGEQVLVLNGQGLQCEGEVETFGRDSVEIKVLERRQVPRLPYQVTLLQALPKGKIIESIIQKATELGVARIVPLLTERVVIHLGEESITAKAAKWRSIAIEAIKQCGSAWLPDVQAPATLPQALESLPKPDLALVGSLQTGSRHSREYFVQYEKAHGQKPVSVSVWVGPEGDFSPGELDALSAAGVRPITLGPLVLRSETAAIYSISVVNYDLQFSASKC